MRLLDAVTQCLLALAARAPTVLVLDDLHWADHGTVALLRHVARFAPRGRLLVLGAYRDVEVDGQHPLREVARRAAARDELRADRARGARYGRGAGAARHDRRPGGAAGAGHRDHAGDERESVLHPRGAAAPGRRGDAGPRRTGAGAPTVAVEAMRIPDTVRQVIERRLGRLGAPARRLLGRGGAVHGGGALRGRGAVAGLTETAGLDALDEALAAQLLSRPPSQTRTTSRTRWCGTRSTRR